MPQHRALFCSGAVTWIACGVIELVLVDMLTIHGRTFISEFVPHAGLLDTMAQTTISFGVLGSNTAFLAFAGFSAWTALSQVFLGILYLMLSRQDAIVLRPFTLLGAIISTAFTVVAAVCFIYPAALGALQAAICFVASWIRKET